MRKNSPQHQVPKAPEKPSSPRLTLRFQPIRPKDDRHGESSKSSSVNSSDPRYQSYCVTMETKEDVYEFKKDDTSISSTRSSSSSPGSDAIDSQLNIVTSSSSRDGDVIDGVRSSKSKPENHVHGHVSNHLEKAKSENVNELDVKNGSSNKMTGEGNNHIRPEYEEASEPEQEEGKRKRRRESKDSNDSKHSASSTTTTRSHKSGNGSRDEKKPVPDSAMMMMTKHISGSDTESTQSDIENDMDKQDILNLNSVNNPYRLSPKVPPLKIVIPTTSILEPDKDKCRSASSKQALPYIVSTSTECGDGKADNMGPHEGMCDKENKDDHRAKDLSYPEERYQRVTRSSQRMAAALASAGSSTMHGQNISMDNSYDPQRMQTGECSTDESMSVEVHPRKRKLRSRDGQSSDACGTPSSHQEEQAVVNSYEMYLNIKRQVDRRRSGMFVVTPKPPQGFKDYLMNRCSYVLAGNAASRLSVPMIPPPQSLTGAMKDLFVGQEKERYKLRLQHIIEKEKLVLSAEQEILRVHGRAARALANQTTPLSVCAVLKDEEIYNHIEPEQVEKVSVTVGMSHHYSLLEEKERNARTRYNGRLFLSWLQDVDDKWEKIKEAMLLRHHNEAESLHAVQKLDWEWKMKEMGVCDSKLSPVIDDIHVPMVHF